MRSLISPTCALAEVSAAKVAASSPPTSATSESSTASSIAAVEIPWTTGAILATLLDVETGVYSRRLRYLLSFLPHLKEVVVLSKWVGFLLLTLIRLKSFVVPLLITWLVVNSR